MDKDDDSKDGGTGQVGLSPPTNATANQTPAQPDVPAWMLARNNSVHAPVFAQPSARKSTGPKPSSKPVSSPKADATKSPFAQLPAQENALQSQEPPPPSNPSPSVDMDTLSDDQALELLSKNETVAGLLQSSFIARVEEYQQKLHQAYDQRLLELEKYTRSWRDTTKELWSALNEGKLEPNNSHREALLWKGPQDAVRGFNPQEHVEKKLDSDGRVACISVRVPTPSEPTPFASVDTNARRSSQPQSRFNRHEWIRGYGSGGQNFEGLGHRIREATNLNPTPRILFRVKNKFKRITFRSITDMNSTIRNINRSDIIMELTSSNVALMGKAFCYLKETNDLLLTQSTGSGTEFTIEQLTVLYDWFSRNATQRRVDVLKLYNGKKITVSNFFAVDIEISATPKKLLIARPCYDIAGEIIGAKFFDIGSDTRTNRWGDGNEIILFEDKIMFSRLASFLSWCINQHTVSISPGTNSPVPNFDKLCKAGGIYTSLWHPREPKHSSEKSGKVSGVAKTPLKACTARLDDKGIELERPAVPKSAASPQPSLFQRTLALSDGLKQLRDKVLPKPSSTQSRDQWLAIGGEPEDVRSLSRSPEHGAQRDDRLPPHGVGPEVLPLESNSQHIVDIASEGSKNSDLIMLERQPKGVTFNRSIKRPLPAAHQEGQIPKQRKLSARGPSPGMAQQLPRNGKHGSAYHSSSSVLLQFPTRTGQLDQKHPNKPTASPSQSRHVSEQGFARDPNPLQPLPSAGADWEIQKLQEIHRLENNFQDNIGQVGESAAGKKTQQIQMRQTKIKGLEGVRDSLREIESSEAFRDNLRRRSHPPSLDVPYRFEALPNHPSPLHSAEYPQEIFTGQGNSTSIGNFLTIAVPRNPFGTSREVEAAAGLPSTDKYDAGTDTGHQQPLRAVFSSPAPILRFLQ